MRAFLILRAMTGSALLLLLGQPRLALSSDSATGDPRQNGQFMMNAVECLRLISDSTDESAKLSSSPDSVAWLTFAEKAIINGGDIQDSVKRWIDNQNSVIQQVARELQKAGNDLQVLGQNTKLAATTDSKSPAAAAIMAKVKTANDDLMKRTFSVVAMEKNTDPDRVLPVQPDDMRKVIAKIEALFPDDCKIWDGGGDQAREAYTARPAAVSAMLIRQDYRMSLSGQ